MNSVEVYSPEWYFQKWPKFYNEKCYHVLADYSAHPEKYILQDDGGVEETKESEHLRIYVDNKNLKRKLCDCDCDCSKNT